LLCPGGIDKRGTGMALGMTVDATVDYTPHMETIQVVLDAKLLQITDRVARRTKQNRSALIREALRAHLKQLEIRALEARDREAYERVPQEADEAAILDAVAAWPEK
jgi:Arc/MetJ-type ribon-helix-helix transcriptional regulator